MMNKQQLKSIEIIDVLKNTLYSSQNQEGEYDCNCDVDFLLSEPITFNIFDVTYVIDRVKMFDWYGDEIGLQYANDKERFCCFKVSKVFAHKIYLRIIEEQKGEGILKGWMLDDNIMDILQDESCIKSCY